MQGLYIYTILGIDISLRFSDEIGVAVIYNSLESVFNKRE